MQTIQYLVKCLLLICLIVGNAYAADPYSKTDRSFVSLTGTVASTVTSKGVGFTLDYGEGIITVEVDDWDWDDDSAGIFPGERVTVNGRIDDDLFETRSIEASSVYVHPRNTYYFASSADEEPRVNTYYPTYPLDGSWLTMTGQVTSTDPEDRSFVLDTGIRKFDVLTKDLGYNPLDEIGIQKVDKGDRVSVTGRLDSNVFTKDDIVASTVVSLTDGKKKGVS